MSKFFHLPTFDGSSTLKEELSPNGMPPEDEEAPSLLDPSALAASGEPPFTMNDLESLVTAPGVVPSMRPDEFPEEDKER